MESKAIRQLPERFEHKGVIYEKIGTTLNAYAFKVTRPEYTCFEVFRRQIGKRNDITSELYPRDNDFGVWAYVCTRQETMNFLLNDLK